MTFSKTPRRTGWLSPFACSYALALVVGATLLLTAGALRAEGGAAHAATNAAAAPKVNELLQQELARIPSGEQGVRELLEPMRSRLVLSAEQERAIRPLIEDGVASMGRMRERFQAGEITPMALMTQLMMTGQQMATKIEPHLSEKQRGEYRAMRQEKRREMMQEMMKRAKPGGAGKP